jgi:beta-glucosidase/6-phospho-beta-glucosidase/beta-galactosidase
MKEVSKKSSDIKKPEIGLAVNVATFHPCFNFSIFDRMSAYLRGVFQNHGFIRSAISGRAVLFPYVFEKLSYKNTLDFIGLNYYFREFVHYKKPFFKNPFGWVCSKAHHYDAGKRTLMGWEVYPRGLYEIVMNFKRYRLPIFVAENGISTYDDSERREYIKEHLKYLLKAIGEGAPVIGYLHWSLIDNFEWSDGYTQKFGLVEVDFKTQGRKIRDSARYLASVIQRGAL